MAKVITTQNFEEEVLKSEKPFLLDFWATWCGPCMRQGPIVEELGEEGYAVGKLDVDQNMEHSYPDHFQERSRSTPSGWSYG